MGAFMVGQAVAAVLAWLWAVMGLRSHPPTPPSASSAQRREGDTAEGPGSWKETLQEVGRQTRKRQEDREQAADAAQLYTQGVALIHTRVTLLLLCPPGVACDAPPAARPRLLPAGVVLRGRAGAVQRAAHRAESAAAAVWLLGGAVGHARRRLPRLRYFSSLLD